MTTATRQSRINELEHAAQRLELEHAAKKLATGKPALLVRAKQAKAEAAALREEIRRLIVTP
jgi:HAMP domain-containing protein